MDSMGARVSWFLIVWQIVSSTASCFSFSRSRYTFRRLFVLPTTCSWYLAIETKWVIRTDSYNKCTAVVPNKVTSWIGTWISSSCRNYVVSFI
jgi:hypothetical protein